MRSVFLSLRPPGRWILLLPLLLLAACDPCSGLGACEAPQVRYAGTVSKRFPGGPAEGVRVEFARTGGVELEPGALEGRADAAGEFILQGRARAEGEVVGTLSFFPPEPIPPVRIEGVRLATSRAPGELRKLGDWKVPYPYLNYQVELRHLATGKPAAGVEVEFRRTGGIPVYPDTFRVTADERGFVLLRPRTSMVGEVVGELEVFPLPPYRAFTVPSVRLATFVEEGQTSVLKVRVGSHLPYWISLVWKETGQGVEKGRGIEGAEVEFRRTGGILIFPERYTSRSDRFGTAGLHPVPLSSGEVVGDVVIRPPPPGRDTTVTGVRLKTYEQEYVHWLGWWEVPLAAP